MKFIMSVYIRLRTFWTPLVLQVRKHRNYLHWWGTEQRRDEQHELASSKPFYHFLLHDPATHHNKLATPHWTEPYMCSILVLCSHTYNNSASQPWLKPTTATSHRPTHIHMHGDPFPCNQKSISTDSSATWNNLLATNWLPYLRHCAMNKLKCYYKKTDNSKSKLQMLIMRMQNKVSDCGCN